MEPALQSAVNLTGASMKTLILAAAVSLSCTASVFAQQAVATGSDAVMAGPGITMGTAATMPLKYVEIKDTDVVTSKLIGIDIYNKANDDVGEISDLVIGDGKSVIGVVASVGGFLGIGESYIVIDPASLAIANDNGTWKAYVDTNKDDLSKAPKFDYAKLKK
jgi:hypothetical protein